MNLTAITTQSGDPRAMYLSPESLFHSRHGWERHCITADGVLHGNQALSTKIIVVMRGNVLIYVDNHYLQALGRDQLVIVPQGAAWRVEALDESRIVVCDCDRELEWELNALTLCCGSTKRTQVAQLPFNDEVRRHINLVEAMLRAGTGSPQLYERHRRTLLLLLAVGGSESVFESVAGLSCAQ